MTPATETTPPRLPLIDHHVHGVVTADLDRAAFELLLTESPLASPPGTTMFDSQLGIAVRRRCAPVLDLEPGVSAERYLERRAELGTREVSRRLLRGAAVARWLIDTGFQASELTTIGEFADLSQNPVAEIVRLEGVAEQVLRSGTSAEQFADAFGAALERASADAVGYKSIVAYRYGFDFDPARPAAAEVAAAAGRVLADFDADPAARLADPVVLRHLIWTAIDTGRPVQFHVGFGDTDVRLHRSDPSLLHDFLLATAPIGTPVMLLHCYPYHRTAGHLAHVFPHVYMDVGAVLNHVGARSAAVLAETLELTPLHKALYSSDAFGLPELHYLGATGFAADIAKVTGAFVADGAWSAADAQRAAYLIGTANAARVYRLAADV